LVVVREKLSADIRSELALLCVTLSDERPTVGDLEVSVIKASHARQFTHPLPYEVHYSSDQREAILRDKVNYVADQHDRDLAAHCTVVRARGVCLTGAPIEEVFGPVLWSDFLDAVLDDWEWIVADDHILESPFYAVLNACRVLQLLTEGEGTVASKEEGAHWALAHVPAVHHAVVRQALDCYRSDRPVKIAERRTGGLVWNATALRCFRDYAASEVMRFRARA
jgi:streptomycin 3"-adenylyltransferase